MIEKISESVMLCISSDHEPLRHMRLSPGIYRHTCLACHKTIVFTVPLVLHSSGRQGFPNKNNGSDGFPIKNIFQKEITRVT